MKGQGLYSALKKLGWGKTTQLVDYYGGHCDWVHLDGFHSAEGFPSMLLPRENCHMALYPWSKTLRGLTPGNEGGNLITNRARKGRLSGQFHDETDFMYDDTRPP